MILGSRFLEPSSFLKGFAAKYLGTAYAQHPDDLAAMGNYAVALAWHGRWKDAEDLFHKGEISSPGTICSTQRALCKINAVISVQILSLPDVRASRAERKRITQQVAASQLNYTDF